MQNNNPKFKILEHPADVRIQAFGKTKEELFLNAMKGMAAVLRPKIQMPKSPPALLRNAKRAGKCQRNIKVESVDINALLVDFLNEVLYLSQVNKEIYNDVKFKKFSDTEVEADLFGNKIESFGEDIKAVTYHGLELHQKKDGIWEATILFDI